MGAALPPVHSVFSGISAKSAQRWGVLTVEYSGCSLNVVGASQKRTLSKMLSDPRLIDANKS